MPRILVADDNANIQKMVALALEEQGIDVVSVGNGEAAVRRIPDLAPDLVLADVFMPVRNGYEVCEFVKKDERFSHVPVILLVGAFDPLDEKEARRVGADGVLKKPFVPPDPLIAMVTSALEKNPKVAAEMAREREAAQPQPEPELPPVALEPPARTAPKPLPEFPEPSPEEAAMIYGFKKPGERPGEDETPARFASPKAEETEEEFDDSATASDWRRSAANFEIPEEVGAKPAFSTDEEYGSTAFPSERDLAPRHYPAEQDEEEITRPHPSSRGFEPALPMEELDVPSTVGHSEPVQPVFSKEERSAASPVVPMDPAQSSPAVDSSLSEYSEEGWMSSILGKFRRSKSAKEEKGEPGSTVDSPPQPITAAPETISTPQVSAAAPEESHPDSGAAEEQVPSALESWFAPHPAVLGHDSEPSDAGPSAFSAAPADNLMSAPADLGSPEYRLPEHSEEKPARPFESHLASSSGFPWSTPAGAPEAGQSGGYSHLGGESGSFGAPAEISSVPDEADRARPAFEEKTGRESVLDSLLPPAPVEHPSDLESADDPAVHNMPAAPIFERPGSLESHQEETGALDHSLSHRIPTGPPPNREALVGIPFLTPPPPTPLGSTPQEASNNDSVSSPWADQTPAPDVTRAESMGELGSHALAIEPSTESANRQSNSDRSVGAAETPSVDAVVSKLMEKLEPRLHELLAKDLLKPLVENLLNEELANKPK